MNDINHFKIPIYDFPVGINDDVETVQECRALQAMIPFAVVGREKVFFCENEHEYVHGREYPWGFVRIDDPDQSDFAALRSVLFGSHLTEFRELTHDRLYEKYRTEKLQLVGTRGAVPSSPGIDTNILLNGVTGSTHTLGDLVKDRELDDNSQLQRFQRDSDDKTPTMV
ncbi:septin SHS1 [Sugiyamaella lignohabitans]|uniref:Septin SHS1 n=1 Tax=Sugiyamaella lignohabitans TaxID=796027 RepID=A0A161HLA9_9ASCO|nr:septin SHS1 [Sugiyamaella lignohabitans]ANB12818.1 septin SHS1 [Sugiyamaella lignohabitans]